MRLWTYKIILSLSLTSCLYFPENAHFVQAGTHIRNIASELVTIK